MSSHNPWFLITGEEIDRLRDGLRDVGDGTDARCTCRVTEMLQIIDTVRDRFA